MQEIQSLVPKIVLEVKKVLDNKEKREFKSFSIDIGPPVLTNNAAFLPILNPTKEIEEFRMRLYLY